ncbi:MAG: STAS domain-containing protein [Acidimicrobiia bacterium]|nr:STAS domain-containing protein [Acidimicrobiia bacterium]
MGTGDGSRAVVLVVDDDVEVTIWRVPSGARPDLVFVDALARLQLAARRLGWSIRLRNPCEELRGLLDLVGLADVLADVVVDGPELPLETGGEAEGGEELGVQEVVDPRDPPA